MPPKKKKSAKKKKKGAEGELTTEDKYKRTMEEIEAMKDHLSMRKELARRSQAASEDWKLRMQSAEKVLEDQQNDQRAVSADMTRQYKTMQTEMGIRIHQLETELARTRAQLEHTELDLKNTTEAKEKMCKEKDEEIADLKVKIDTMGLQYESALNDAMDRLIEKIINAKGKWDESSTVIQERNKQTLFEFGLNPLDI